jgi:hypothetical protein
MGIVGTRSKSSGIRAMKPLKRLMERMLWKKQLLKNQT